MLVECLLNRQGNAPLFSLFDTDILFQLDELGRQHLPRITLSMTAAIKGAQIQLERRSGKSSDEEIATCGGVFLG